MVVKYCIFPFCSSLNTGDQKRAIVMKYDKINEDKFQPYADTCIALHCLASYRGSLRMQEKADLFTSFYFDKNIAVSRYF